MQQGTSARPPIWSLLRRPDGLAAPPDFIEFLPIAAYACDAAGRILWYNTRAADLWGRTPRVGTDSELYCGAHRLIFGGREIDRTETPMAHVLRTGEAINGAEGIVIRPDGSQARAMVHISPVRDDAGNVIGAINCFHDVTELGRLTHALKARQDELEDFFENGSMALHIVSAEGIILRANQAELAMLGYSAEEYIGKPIADFHVDAETIGEILATLSACQKLDRRPARLKTKNGGIRHVLITSTPRVEDGRFINTRCFTEDITAQVEAQSRVAYTEERYRQLLEAVPAAIYTTDAEGVITYFNEHARQMAGTTPVVGRTQWCVSYRLYDSEGKPLPLDQCPMAVALKENRPVRNVEILVERPDGRVVPVLPHPTPLHDKYGRLVGAVNMLVDISDRKQAEHRQITLLRELNHRVKNNLQLLQALLSSAHRASGNIEAKGVLDDAVRRVQAMAAAQRVLHDEASPAHVEARQFLEAVSEGTRSALPSGASIEIEAATGVLSNDAAMPLALIVNELIINAVKHGLPTDKVGAIRIGLQEQQGEVRLWVHDLRIGLRLRRQASQPRQRVRVGARLGAAVARYFLRRPRAGCPMHRAFSAGLRCKRRMSRMIDWGASPAEKPPLPPISGVNHDATANRRATARVLVVEDDYFIAMEIEDALRNAGYEVVGLAATATEAEAMARNTGPHMAIMDIRLAGRRDGVEAATELYNKLGIRSLFATAHEDAEMRRRAAAARPLGWLAKPFSPTMLIDAVKAALAQL